VTLVKPENHWSEDPSKKRFIPAHLRGLARPVDWTSIRWACWY
jgi:hypothetical protein